MFFGSSTRALATAALAATALACGGTITFADDPDAEPGQAQPDAGPVGNIDGSVAQPDATVACTPRTRPTVPGTWPYPMTGAAYLNNFANRLPTTSCSIATCHGNQSPPYIPSNADLAVAANANRAITELWLRARPPVAGPAILRRKHAADGDALPPTYTPQMVAAIDEFLRLAYDCAWRSAPPPQPGECPPPDTSYCDL